MSINNRLAPCDCLPKLSILSATKVEAHFHLVNQLLFCTQFIPVDFPTKVTLLEKDYVLWKHASLIKFKSKRV